MEKHIQVVPFDVWFEIFRRIPAADLIPLKETCKTFHRLISSDLFVRLHFEYFTKAKRAMVITVPSPTDHATPFHYDPDKRTISVWHDEPRIGDLCRDKISHRYLHWVTDSYHGLLLLQICDRLLLCNPITKSYKFLILPPVDSGYWKIAYDDVSKQYKVLGLSRSGYEFSLYVFDVHREGELHPSRRIKVMKFKEGFRCESVLVNGSVYWLIVARWSNTATCIVSANVTTEEVKTRSFSSTPIIWSHYVNIFAANGTFYLVQTYDPNYALQLWVLDGFENENPNPNPSWMIKHRIKKSRLPSILRNFDEPTVGVFGDKMLIMVTNPSHQNELYQYDLGNEELEIVTLTRNDNNESFVYFHIIEHIDSLLSLDGTNR